MQRLVETSPGFRQVVVATASLLLLLTAFVNMAVAQQNNTRPRSSSSTTSSSSVNTRGVYNNISQSRSASSGASHNTAASIETTYFKKPGDPFTYCRRNGVLYRMTRHGRPELVPANQASQISPPIIAPDSRKNGGAYIRYADGRVVAVPGSKSASQALPTVRQPVTNYRGGQATNTAASDAEFNMIHNGAQALIKSSQELIKKYKATKQSSSGTNSVKGSTISPSGKTTQAEE